MDFLWWKEKRLRTAWRVQKNGHTSFLVGTAHFSPYRFKKALIKLIQNVDIVLFEGPLDQESMARVVRYGQKGENAPSLYKALHPDVIVEINKLLSARSSLQTTAVPYLDLIHPTTSDFLEIHTRGVRPWMAFFIIWSAFLNWKHSMDLEAFQISQRFGKKIQYLETIDDQLAALDGVPFERIVNYLNHIDHWKAHKKAFAKAFLEGNIQQFYSVTGEFPTRCDSILTQRNLIFFKRMKIFFEEAEIAAFVGVAHIPGIRDMFLNEGYLVTQEES